MKKQLLIFLSLLSLPSLLFAHFGENFEGGWGGHHMGMGGSFGGGWIMMAAIIILVVLTLTFVGRWAFGNRNLSSSSAQTILVERFAKGEIDEETFQKMRKSLK
jgi:putative membrane protein